VELIEWLDGESSEIEMNGTPCTIQEEVNLKSETLYRLLAEEGEVEMDQRSLGESLQQFSGTEISEEIWEM